MFKIIINIFVEMQDALPYFYDIDISPHNKYSHHKTLINGYTTKYFQKPFPNLFSGRYVKPDKKTIRDRHNSKYNLL
jgi:hypothetical protein